MKNSQILMMSLLCLVLFFVQMSSAKGQAVNTDSVAVSLLSQMTLRQKTYELHGHGVIKFGLSILVSRKVRSVKAGGNRRLGIPPTIFLDGPRGVSLYKGTTAFPVTMARGASWDPELEQRVGEAIATEILALGANYSGAVCMNILRHPAWGRAQETYGEDPYHVGQMAVALTKGIQSLGVQACAKHFAVNSMENNRFGGNFIVDENVLHEVYLPHFKKVIEAGAASVMSAYNQLNGEYCGHSRSLLTDILRKQWGFRGYVTSDWQHGLRDAKAGILAGMNVEMPSGKHYSVKNIKWLLKMNEISMLDIDSLVLPIIRTKLAFEAKRTEPRPSKDALSSASHRALACEVAEKSAVLLKNTNITLPLNRNALRNIAVIGSLANSTETGDHGSSQVFATDVVSPLDGITSYLAGSNARVLTSKRSDATELKTICQNADAVVVVAGMTWHDEGEYIGRGGIRDSLDREKLNPIVKMKVLGRGGDRKHLNLHPHDIATIKAAAAVNDRVIVVLVAGSAIMVEEWHEDAAAILQTFYNGVEGGTALARLLFGEVNPSGKLPFTVPSDNDHLPPFPSFDAAVTYLRFHGYTLFDKKGFTPRYPFGHGLSYSTFTISVREISNKEYHQGDSLELTVDVHNTGGLDGSEVIQVYVSPCETSSQTADRLLCAFEKVHLRADESKTVTLVVPINSLLRHNSGSWSISPGSYILRTGCSSDPRYLQPVEFQVGN